MAKRRTRRAASRVQVIRAPAPRAQIIQVRPSGSPARRSGRRKGGHKGGHGGTKTLFAAATGGALLGFIDQALGTKLPTIPILGRAGTIAVGAYMLGKGRGSGMLRDIALAAAAVAGYEIGTKGSVSGMIPSQVRGVAAQV